MNETESFYSERQSFREMLLDNEMSANTVRSYMSALGAFSYYYESGGFRVIDKACIIGYKQCLISKYKPSTVNSHIIALNKFLSFIGQDEMRVKTLKMQMNTSVDNRLTFDEYWDILDASTCINRSLYFVVITISTTGIRVSELKYITYESVNRGFCSVSNKGKIRHIVIPSEVCAILLQYCQAEGINKGPVFLSKRTGRATGQVTIWRWIQEAAQLAGVEINKAYTHNLRHFFARHFLNKFGDLTELADLLGHSKIETTRIYTRPSTEERRRKLDILSKDLIRNP